MPDVALSVLAPTLTVTVRAVLKVSPSVEAVTVTVVTDAPSDTLFGSAFSVRPVLSSSVSVTLVPFTVSTPDVPATVIASAPSISVSSVGVSVNVPVPLVLPAVMVMSKPVTAA